MKVKIFRSLFIRCSIISLLFASGLSYASSKNSMSFENWVERLRNQAFSKGISVDTLQNTFLQNQQLNLNKPPTPLAKDSMQNNLALSRLLLKQYGDDLFEISHLFGVDMEVMAAIVSLENSAIENHGAIDILINQSFQKPRDVKLQNELLQALKIIDEGQIGVEQLKSDMQGRMGKTRFRPSVFRDYAIDFDGDGQYDIWQNYADIFASTANYLSNIGWKTGQKWGFEVELPESFDMGLVNINQQKSLSTWQEFGVSQADGNELPTSPELASLIQIETDKFYIVQDNYFTLLRWRRSTEYVYSVGQLIDYLKNKTNPMDVSVTN